MGGHTRSAAAAFDVGSPVRDDGGRPDLPLILAIVALAGVAAIGAYLLGSSGSDDENADRAQSTATETTIIRERPRRRRGSGRDRVAPVSRWPAGVNAYTVVLASSADRSQAEATASRASGVSGVHGVLNSSDFASLRPGYWVAFAGVHSTTAAASSAATTLRARGFGDAYVRYVSASESAPASSPPALSGFTVVVASERSRASAASAARRARDSGFGDASVLDSDDYSNLRPGLWVAHLGAYPTLDAARVVATRARSAGFADAYTRSLAGHGTGTDPKRDHSCGSFRAAGYRIRVSANARTSCTTALAVERERWLGPRSGKRVVNGGTGASGYTELERYPGWRCTSGSGGGGCRKGSLETRYQN